MDWVVTRQLQSKKALEKQLNEIEAKRRQSEAKRQREVINLELDLSKLQKSTVDLDDVYENFSPRYHRRGSLPILESSSRSLASLETSAYPLSRRRLSIAAIPQSPSILPRILIQDFRDDTPQQKNDRLVPNMTLDKDKQNDNKSQRRGSNSSISSTTGLRRGSKTGVVTTTNNSTNKIVSKPPTARKNSSGSTGQVKSAGRRGSNESVTKSDMPTSKENGRNASPKRKGSVDNGGRRGSTDGASHNITAVYVHQDDQPADRSTTPDDEMSEAESNSMFAKYKSRRASEPALGGHFIRALQDDAVDEIPVPRPQSGVDTEDLKKSIQKNLPSDIVAEGDEGEEDEDDADAVRGDAGSNKPRAKSAKKLQVLPPQKTDVKSTAQSKSKVTMKTTAEPTPGKGASSSPERESFQALRQRRKSAGDALLLAKSWKLQEARNKSGRRDIGSASASRQGDDFGVPDKKDEIWNAVRKCRYIRGYEPPEMSQPDDLAEYVFGHKNPD